MWEYIRVVMQHFILWFVFKCIMHKVYIKWEYVYLKVRILSIVPLIIV